MFRVIPPNVVIDMLLVDFTQRLTKSFSHGSYLLERGPVDQSSVPSRVMGKFLRWVVSWEQLRNYLVGDDKDKVGESDLVTGEIGRASLPEMLIDHTDGALDCVFVAVEGRLDMLWVFVQEPCVLGVVHVLFGRLILHPCEFRVLIWAGEGVKGAGFIVCVEDIEDDSSSLLSSDRIGISIGALASTRVAETCSLPRTV